MSRTATGALTIISCLALGVAYAQERPGLDIVAQATVPLDGREVTLTFPDSGDAEDYVLTIEGNLHCSIDGGDYGPGRYGDEERGIIRLAPTTIGYSGLGRGHSDPGGWGSVSFVAPGIYGPSERELEVERPEHAGIYVDVDHLVRRFIVTPSEARDSLTGEITATLYRRRPRWDLIILAMAGGALAIGACFVGAIRWLRRDPGADMRDVETILRRIDEKYPRVRDAIDSERWDAGELKSQLKRLHGGAHELARHIGAFRETARRVDREQLAAEIAGIEKQLEGADREELRREIEATLEEKRKVQGLLADTDANEARYVLRLSKIDSALDAVALQLTEQDSRLADDRTDRKAIDALGSELKSLDEAIGELSILDDVPT